MAVENPKRKRNGAKTGPALLARLAEPEFRDRVQVTEQEMRVLDLIASGEYVRNANAIITAIKLKIESAYPRQVQPLEVHAVPVARQAYFPGDPVPAPELPTVPDPGTTQ